MRNCSAYCGSCCQIRQAMEPTAILRQLYTTRPEDRSDYSRPICLRSADLPIPKVRKNKPTEIADRTPLLRTTICSFVFVAVLCDAEDSARKRMASYVGSVLNDSPTAEFVLMTVSVMLFARAKDLAGTDRIELELEADGTILDLKRALINRCPLMSSISDSLLWAVNNQYAHDTTTVRPTDTVACFPPVSGG